METLKTASRYELSELLYMFGALEQQIYKFSHIDDLKAYTAIKNRVEAQIDLINNEIDKRDIAED